VSNERRGQEMVPSAVIPPRMTTEEFERFRGGFLELRGADHITVLPPDPMEVMIRESAAAYGQAFIYRDPSTGEEQVLDPQHVTIVKPMPVEPSLPELDLDWHGDAYGRRVGAGHVVSFRRLGPQINFGITPGGATVLTPDEAEDLAANLYAAARAARKAAST
jgi:hypothetical protein